MAVAGRKPQPKISTALPGYIITGMPRHLPRSRKPKSICALLAPDGPRSNLCEGSFFHEEERGMKKVGAMPLQVSDEQKPRPRQKKRERRRTWSEQEIDESLEDSFPASDPPTWTPLRHIGSPR
jgi:hypothetical protein